FCICQCETQDTLASCPLLPYWPSRIIEIEHGNPLRGEAIKDLSLGLDDLVRTAELADMGSPGIGNQADIRTRQTNRICNFTQPRGTELDDCGLVLRRQFEQGQRHAELVVQVAARGQYRIGAMGRAQ